MCLTDPERSAIKVKYPSWRERNRERWRLFERPWRTWWFAAQSERVANHA